MLAFEHFCAAFTVRRPQDKVFLFGVDEKDPGVVKAEAFTDQLGDERQKRIEVLNRGNGVGHAGDQLELRGAFFQGGGSFVDPLFQGASQFLQFGVGCDQVVFFLNDAAEGGLDAICGEPEGCGYEKISDGGNNRSRHGDRRR
jgi:hypothetical protein